MGYDVVSFSIRMASTIIIMTFYLFFCALVIKEFKLETSGNNGVWSAITHSSTSVH